MSVRKRKWTTSRGAKRTAWVADYIDQDGKRRLEHFDYKYDAVYAEHLAHWARHIRDDYALVKIGEKIAADLAWRGPGGRPLGTVVLTRDEAQIVARALATCAKISERAEFYLSEDNDHDTQDQDTS